MPPTKLGPFEVRNKSFIIIAAGCGKAKFHTNISCTLHHFWNLCIVPHYLKLLTAAVASCKNFGHRIIYLIWLGVLVGRVDRSPK